MEVLLRMGFYSIARRNCTLLHPGGGGVPFEVGTPGS